MAGIASLAPWAELQLDKPCGTLQALENVGTTLPFSELDLLVFTLDKRLLSTQGCQDHQKLLFLCFFGCFFPLINHRQKKTTEGRKAFNQHWRFGYYTSILSFIFQTGRSIAEISICLSSLLNQNQKSTQILHSKVALIPQLCNSLEQYM